MIVGIAVAVGAVALLSDDGSSPGEPSPQGAPADTSLLAVDASGPVYSSLGELVDASELIVRGRVVATSRGRMVGSQNAAIESRLVTVEVDDVLRGTGDTPTLLVEEEGWLNDGTPIAVNGLAPSIDGLDAVWFLVPIPDPELPGYLVVNHQGRYAVGPDGTLTGAAVEDAVIDQVEHLSVADLEAAILG